MHITSGQEKIHAEKLKQGLIKLGSNYVAIICWWCEGKGFRKFEHCTVCGKNKPYATGLGVLINNQPAPESVVNQILVAADA